MNSTFINVIQVTFLVICNLLFSYFMFFTLPYFKNMYTRHAFAVSIIIAYSIVSFYALQNAYYVDGFYFEVSPNRKKCLQEQVEPIPYRSCGCCGKGTVGGYPARYIYKDLIGSDDSWDWNRVDAYGKEASITPPTDQCSV